MTNAAAVDDTAKKLGYTLYDEQRTVCLNYLRNRDSFFLAPTGFGKSITYILCPLLFKQPCIVIIITPTIALIEDNILKLQKLVPEMKTVHLTRSTLESARDATYIFTTPESLLSDSCGRKLLIDESWRTSVAAIFIDECHLVLEWGMSSDWEANIAFREKYGDIGMLRSFLDAPFIAMTATATPVTIKQITDLLSMSHHELVEVNMNKMNIMYHVISQDGVVQDFNWIVNMLRTGRPPRTLIFFNNHNTMTDCYAYILHHTLLKFGDPTNKIVMFSSLASSEIKGQIIGDLNEPDGVIRIALCTTSMSVGVSLCNIEYVIHYGMTSDTISFLQSTGRAAREKTLQGHSITITLPKMFAGRKVSSFVRSFCSERVCRRKSLLEEYVSRFDSPTLCCDICQPNHEDSLKCLIMASTHLDSSISSSSSSSSESELDIGGVDFSD